MYRLLLPAPGSAAAWAVQQQRGSAAGRLLLASPSGPPTWGCCWNPCRPAHRGLCPRPAHYPGLLLLLQLPPGAMQIPDCRLATVGGSSAPGKPQKEGSNEECIERAPDTVEDVNKLTKTQQLKKVFKEYGAVGVTFHVGISLVSLGIFYLIVSSGVDITALLLKLGFSEAVVQSKMAAGTSTFVLAYAIHKLFAPVRISITVMSVPFIVRYFRKIGFFKPPTPES